jgi:hypothetical protein
VLIKASPPYAYGIYFTVCRAASYPLVPPRRFAGPSVYSEATTRGLLSRNLPVAALCVSVLASSSVSARDDGRYANQPLHAWFDQLASGKGLCCSFADGFSISDVDWDTQDGNYRVRLHGEWIVVPDNAVITEPNRFGPAVVWPYLNAEGTTQIRCFMPGAGA